MKPEFGSDQKHWALFSVRVENRRRENLTEIEESAVNIIWAWQRTEREKGGRNVRKEGTRDEYDATWRMIDDGDDLMWWWALWKWSYKKRSWFYYFHKNFSFVRMKKKEAKESNIEK